MSNRESSTRESSIWDQLPSLDATPYPVGARSSLAAITPKYSFSADPRDWGSSLSTDLVESDDEQYTSADGFNQREGMSGISFRGAANTGGLLLLLAGLLALFIGYPVITYYDQDKYPLSSGQNFGNTNASGQVPQMFGNFGLIDEDTPQSLYTMPSWEDSHTEMQLVFSDEFNIDGRTFYPGDDPYWEAVDLHYWATNNLEWYDPEALTTQNGSLVITLSQKQTHGMDFEGGLMSTWNKFCFTGGYVEANVQLPGANNILGLWPAIWTVGNLGRAGYGATLEGVWPYSYDTCDVGTVANQTVNGLPLAATTNPAEDGPLSYLPGQRLSRCTCAGESHPGPKHADGTYVGRAAPEIDIFEAQIQAARTVGEVSQSAQWAPFNAAYLWNNSPDNMILYNTTVSELNNYVGGKTQQATSVTTITNQNCYELESGCYSVYGFEYKAGFDNGYITWVSSGQPSWTLKGPGMGPDPSVQIGARPISSEPMYLIMNLGLSKSFGAIDLNHLTFPVHMKVDYIRVYQPQNAINIGCDPQDFPTSSYINRYIDAYTNPNLTTWVDDYHQTWPKNSFLGQC